MVRFRIASEEISFVFSHDQDRTRRVLHDAFGGAAEKQMLQAGMTARRCDDQIYLEPSRKLADFVISTSSHDVKIFGR